MNICFWGNRMTVLRIKKSVNDVHIHDVVYLNMEERLEWNHMTEIVL